MKRNFLSLALISLFFACHPSLTPSRIAYKDYVVNASAGAADSLTALLVPYRDSVGQSMGEVLAENEAPLVKEMPNSSLGNFLAEAYLWAAREKFDKRADVAFMNHGGVRINNIGSGAVTRGMIYEVMPFDNQLVIVPVKGSLLKAYADRLAADGGGGGVAGLTMRIVDKKAEELKVGGKPLDPGQTYYMVNSDYAVDGGGGFKAFKELTQNRTGYLQRDAIIEYVRMIKSSGKKINADYHQRITK